MIVWIMCGIVVCVLWLAARHADNRGSDVDAIVEEEITVPRQRTADRHAYAVACLDRNGEKNGRG